MTNLGDCVKEYQGAASNFQAARQFLETSRASLWQTFAPILSRHEKEIGELFEETGFSELYREKFGQAYGNRLCSVHVYPRYIEFALQDCFRGTVMDYEFRLPRKYLTGDPYGHLEADLAYYRRVLERLTRGQRRREQAEERAANLAEFARLRELFKHDPEANRE